MLTKNINFTNYLIKGNQSKIRNKLNSLLSKNLAVLTSLKASYQNSYKKKFISKLKNYTNIRIIGMGGSILGAEAIHDFLKFKIIKNFSFINNLSTKNYYFKNNKKNLNIIISKSGNTLETISNVNILIKKKDKNIFITENKKSYLRSLANKLKSEIIHHNNFIGGRYSVLSEVGMLPAELMGLKEKKFKQFNNLVKNKKFVNNLIYNVSAILELQKKKSTSIILNYDQSSDNFFRWYQQLVAESLGKKSKGILPVISTMPKDNHSLMQLYLDGPQKNFYTFFYVLEKNVFRIDKKKILSDHNYLKNKSINQIIYSQKLATEKVFNQKKIPFRSFEILNRSEESIGELFCFFILETILLGMAMNVNPFDQPSVELIKEETIKNLI